MNDITDALEDFRTSGYNIDVVIASPEFLPLDVKTEADGRQSVIYNDRVIFTIGATKTEGEAKVVVHLGDQQIDLMEQFRSQMRKELL